jgi:Rrf2 family transcriptional regulator, iron-sulfur cluster assembly transcription factor
MSANPLLNRSTRIGIAAMSALAEASATDAPALTTVEIARRRHIPQPYLAKVLTVLSRNDLIRGARGPGGGYVLARPAEGISLHDIASCFEHMDQVPHCPLGRHKPCPTSEHCPLHEPFLKLWRAQVDFLTSTTLKGFAEKPPLSSSPRRSRPR